MMFRQFVSCALMAILLTSCTHLPKMGFPSKSRSKPSHDAVFVSPGHNIQQIRTLGSFSRVSVTGLINVNLHTGALRSQVVLHGDTRDLSNLRTDVANGQLLVSLGKGYPHFGSVTVDIYTHYLTSFSYTGRGRVMGSHLRSSSLDLMLMNSGQTSLEGQLVLHKVAIGSSGATQIAGINGTDLRVLVYNKAKVQLVGMVNAASFTVKDESSLSLYWVKSDSLTLRAKDKGFIQLAGIVDRLEVELWNRAHYNGRYLRAEQTFVKTHGFSMAEIATLRHQHTLAMDQSNIYFYELPLARTDFMAFNGAVLDMREGDQHYTQYNH